MFFLKNIKFFLNDLDFLISKSFFYFQCSFRFVLKDFIKTKFSKFKFSNNFEIKKESIKMDQFDENYSENFVKRTLYSEYTILENLDINQQYIFSSNHASLLDVPVTLSILKRPVLFMAKRDYF